MNGIAATSRRFRPGSRTRGVSLIEVLVALLILSVGLLGLAGLQTASLQYNHSASLRTQANNFAYDMADRMRVNRNAAVDGHYNIDKGGSLPTGNSVADQDVAEWVQTVRNTLPDGDASIHVNNNATGTITIEWDDSRGEEDRVRFQLVVRL